MWPDCNEIEPFKNSIRHISRPFGPSPLAWNLTLQLDTSTPHSPNRQGISNIGRWVHINQQKISSLASSYLCSITQPKTICRKRSGSSQRLDRSKPASTDIRNSWWTLAPCARQPRWGCGTEVLVPTRTSSPALFSAEKVVSTSLKLPCGNVLKPLERVACHSGLSLLFTLSSAAKEAPVFPIMEEFRTR
jgi:hypothetical protein